MYYGNFLTAKILFNSIAFFQKSCIYFGLKIGPNQMKENLDQYCVRWNHQTKLLPKCKMSLKSHQVGDFSLLWSEGNPLTKLLTRKYQMYCVSTGQIIEHSKTWLFDRMVFPASSSSSFMQGRRKPTKIKHIFQLQAKDEEATKSF